jgi:nucleotide-binding universal stress UspA family protein
MYRNILVATDGSRLSAKAITHAIALARALGAKLTGFYASPDYPLPVYADGVMYEAVSPREYAAMCKKEADRILSAIGAKAKAAGIRFTAVQAVAAAPWEAILAAARNATLSSWHRMAAAACRRFSSAAKLKKYSLIPSCR